MLTTENGLNSICRRNANQSRFQREWTGKKKDSELLHQAQKIVSNLLNKRDPFTRITNHRVCNLTGESYKVLRNLEKITEYKEVSGLCNRDFFAVSVPENCTSGSRLLCYSGE